MLMFGGNKNAWIAQELSNISQMLSRVASELSALNQDVKNMHAEQGKQEGRITQIDERVRVLENDNVEQSKQEERINKIDERTTSLETSKVEEKSKWDGVKVIWAVAAAILTTTTVVLGIAVQFI